MDGGDFIHLTNASFRNHFTMTFGFKRDHLKCKQLVTFYLTIKIIFKGWECGLALA
jgi:hypothetical protein